MKLKRLIAATAFAILIISIWFLLRLNVVDDKKAIAMANWLRSTNLKRGMNANVKLPAQFSSLAARGSVDVMLQQNGKLAYLLKSKEELKGNYQGYVYVDSNFPLTISKDYYGRSLIDIFGSGGDYIVVDKKVSNNLYAVFSDLG